MNRTLSLIIAAVIIGFVIFALFYWILGRDLMFATNVAISGAIGGLVVEFMRATWDRRKQTRTKN